MKNKSIYHLFDRFRINVKGLGPTLARFVQALENIDAQLLPMLKLVFGVRVQRSRAGKTFLYCEPCNRMIFLLL